MSGRRPRLTFSRRALDKMIDLAWSTYPSEVVGLLGGNRLRVKSVYGLRNLASGLAFLADPHDQYQAMRKIELAGERLIATFHSHPEGAAKLSATDSQYVFEVASAAIVIGLRAAGHTTHLAAFKRAAGGIEETAEIVVQS